MDPVSQGTLGAALPLSLIKTKKWRSVAWVGCLSGMAPDLDVLIRSKSDPLLFLEYHRQFTHSLLFIPIGGVLCGILLYSIFFKKHLSFRQTVMAACLGYGTHALLDACTSYGTQLFWPLSTYRVSWNNVSIIDPLFTLPLLVGLILSLKIKKQFFIQGALIYSVGYLLLGVWQRNLAEAHALKVANSKGVKVVRVSAKPSFANLILWKVITETKDRYYVDAVRVLPWGHEKWYVGESIKKFDSLRDLPWLDQRSQHSKDVERFRWFSQNHIALHPQNPLMLIDIRYSLLPNEIEPLWGIVFNPDRQDEHVLYKVTRKTSRLKRETFWSMLLGKDL